MRRRFRQKLTPEQTALARYRDRAEVRCFVIGHGLAEWVKNVDSAADLEIVQSIIDNDLEPAVKLAERTQADLEASYSKRSKTPIVERSKSRRKDPKPAKAKP